MKGNFYIQKTRNGLQIEKPQKHTGYIDCKDKKLNCFLEDHSFMLEMDVLDITISADGMLFKGIEDLNGRKLYNEIWFLPKGK
jgi:hypothetical protein